MRANKFRKKGAAPVRDVSFLLSLPDFMANEGNQLNQDQYYCGETSNKYKADFSIFEQKPFPHPPTIY